MEWLRTAGATIFCLAYLMAGNVLSAQAGSVTIGLYQGIRLHDLAVVDSKDNTADLTVTPRYKGYVAYAALDAPRLQEFKTRPDLATLTPAAVERYDQLVFAPAAGYYYLVRGHDGRYSLCKLERFENQGQAASRWKLTFSVEEVSLGTAQHDSPPLPTASGVWHGKKDYPDGTAYEGDFLNGKFHGQGVLRTADGFYYQGEFRQGAFHGQGLARLADGSSYQGQFVDGVMQGHGVLKMPDGAYYEGEFAHGKMNGQGVLKQPDGRYYQGEFADNQAHGQGAIYDASGKLLKQGRWEHNEFVAAAA